MKDRDKILVEQGEGGCWHEWIKTLHNAFSMKLYCDKCGKGELDNPDFSKWENFGRLLKMAINQRLMQAVNGEEFRRFLKSLILPSYESDVDQIPTLVADEIAKKILSVKGE